MGTTVVVGAGIAGVRTVQALARLGHTDRIVVVGGESHAPYDRPPLSKQVLHREGALPVLSLDAPRSGPEAEWRVGVTATGLNANRHELLTDAGAVGYDALVIATGAYARRVPGLPGKVLRTWDDAVMLRNGLREGSTLTVVGAGLIGCEVASSARKMGAQVHLVDILEGPMERVVGSSLASVVAKMHRQHGVELHFRTSVKEVADGKVHLVDGTSFATDIVLHAVGALPATAWLAGSGLDITSGVLCDYFGRTEAQDVYAVGDVAAWGGSRSEHWTNAIEQAAVVAAVITGHDTPPLPLPYWWSDQYDVKFQGLGSVAGTDEVRIGAWGPAGRMVALYGRLGRLGGVVGLSAAKVVMGLRAAVASGVPMAEVEASLGAAATTRVPE